jgi:hypothetical protein
MGLDGSRNPALTWHPTRRRRGTSGSRGNDRCLVQGLDLRLQVNPRTLQLLDERAITVHVGETREAVEIYNELAEVAQVAGAVPFELLTPGSASARSAA